MQDGQDTRVDFDEGPSQGEQIVYYIPKRPRWRDQLQVLENLWKQVNDHEIELRGRRRRRDREGSFDDPDYNAEESSRGDGSRRSRYRFHETAVRRDESPHHGRHSHNNAALEAMSRALKRAARSPFTKEIECMEMPKWFARCLFTIYDEKIDPIGHVSHYIQMMSLYLQNDGLMCKVFLSSLGQTAMRWFNGLRKGSIWNFGELMQAFGAQFIMCSKVPQPIAALLSMRIRSSETLRSYNNRYWELYNEIRGGINK